MLPIIPLATGCLTDADNSNIVNTNTTDTTDTTDNTMTENPHNKIIVGHGADFENVARAMNSITDNSENNPYIIEVMPGVYPANWAVKQWVTVIGSGPLSTIFEGTGEEGIKIGQSNIDLKNFGIRFTTNQPTEAAIARNNTANSIYLSEIHIELLGPGTAIMNSGGNSMQTWWLRDIKIRTEGSGLDIGGLTYCDDLKIFLFGVDSGHSHVGCRVAGPYARIYLNNCRIGTGYGFEYQGKFIPNEVSGDDDVIGIWIPTGHLGTRIQVHGLESFCRNEDTINPSVNVNVIRAEVGWVRAFGCFGQAETPANWSLRKTLVQSGEGKIEQYACRFTGIQGDSFGSGTLGVQTFTDTYNGYVFDKFEAGLHRLDASGNAFTLRLRPPRFGIIPGEVHIFKKVDGLNQVTIDLNGGTLEGDPNNQVLIDQYAELKIAWDGIEWVRV